MIEELTPCCHAFYTWGDDGPFCKKCYEPVNILDLIRHDTNTVTTVTEGS